jgi:hypothetical protein
MFGRRKRGNTGEGTHPDPSVLDSSVVDSDGSESTQDASDVSTSPTSTGPWDIAEAPESDARIDLGAIQILGAPGLSVQVQMDEKTQRPMVVTLTLDDATVQVQVFAAPRTGGLWEQVRGQLTGSISSAGGLVEEIEGPFGVELRAQVPGQKGLTPARFVGVDGPRWFLRGLFLGSGASPTGHDGLLQVFSDLVVVRGTEAMPVGDAIPFTLPEGLGPSAAGSADETPAHSGEASDK